MGTEGAHERGAARIVESEIVASRLGLKLVTVTGD